MAPLMPGVFYGGLGGYSLPLLFTIALPLTVCFPHKLRHTHVSGLGRGLYIGSYVKRCADGYDGYHIQTSSPDYQATLVSY
jgi:hypothetical protein